MSKITAYALIVSHQIAVHVSYVIDLAACSIFEDDFTLFLFRIFLYREPLIAKAGIIRKAYKGKKGACGKNFLNWQLKAKGRSINNQFITGELPLRAFSSLKRTYHLGKEETRGILSVAKNVYLALLPYMLSSLHC